MKINEWGKYQSYKDRKPPWIRFHRAILDNYKFQMMSADARAILPMLWLLACEHKDPSSGVVDAPMEEISFRLRQTEKLLKVVFEELQVAGFIKCNEFVTKPLRDSNQTVTPETETETETEANNNHVEKAPFLNGSYHEVFLYWQKVHNHPRAKLDDKRKRKINSLLKIGYTVDDLKTAVDGCKASPFHQGQNKRKTIYDDIELICRDASHVDKFIKTASLAGDCNTLSEYGQRAVSVAKSWLEKSNG